MYIWNHEIDDPIGMKTGMTLLKLAILAKNESAVKALVERRTKKGLPIDDPISVSTTAMYGMVNVLVYLAIDVGYDGVACRVRSWVCFHCVQTRRIGC